MKGVILAGGLGTRLAPLTKITNKHLLPVYNKPMIFYPIQTLVDAGVRDLLIVTGGNNAGDFLRLLGNGSAFNLPHINYTHQEGEGGIADALRLAEHFADGQKLVVMLGDNVIEKSIRHGVAAFRKQKRGARVYLKQVPRPEAYGVAELRGQRIVRIVEKPKRSKSNYAVIGIYMYDPSVFDIIRSLKPSGRGELEITDVNNAYIKRRELEYEILDGWWADAGASHQQLLETGLKVSPAMTRVLVTGGAGFIGSHFIKFAQRAHPDWHLVNLDKLSYAGNLENLTHLPAPTRHQFVKGDIADHELISRLWTQGIDLVVNFAAETHVDRSILWADDFIKTDVLGAFTLLEAAREFGVKKFIQISTDEVYGSIENGSFHENSPLNPRNPYSASKAGADRLAYAYFATHNVPVLVTRCSNNFGPNQYPEKFIPLFITNALEDKPLPLYGDGRNVRDWIHVEDHCAAVDFLLEHGAPGETYNIAGGNEVQNIDIARRIVSKLHKPDSLIQLVKDRPGHDRRYSLDAGKLAALGWRPQRDFTGALDATVDWYVHNEAWWRKLKGSEFKKYYQAQYGHRMSP